MTETSGDRVFDRALSVGLTELEEGSPGSVGAPPTQQRRLAIALLAAGVAVCVGGWFALREEKDSNASASAPHEEAVRVGVWQDPKVQDPKKPLTVSLRFRNMDGAAAIMDVARAGRLNVVLRSDIEGTINSMVLDKVPADKALTQVVAALGAELVPAGGPVVRARMPLPEEEPGPRGDFATNIDGARLKDVVTLIQKLGHPVVLEKTLEELKVDMKGQDTPLRLLRTAVADQDALVLHQGKALYLRPAGDNDRKVARVRFHFRNAEVATVAGAIARISGTNIVVPPTKKRVTLSLYDLPWPRALEAIARVSDMELHVEKPNLFRLIAPKK